MIVDGGNGVDKRITTGAGNDTIDGGMGADTINAGAGNDTVIGTADGANDSYDGGSGDSNTIDYSAITTPISVDLAAGAATGVDIGTDNLANFQNVNGGSGNDSLFGSNSGNVIHGGAGDDNIVGGSGSDKLFGDAGNDTLNGGVNDSANDFLTGGLGNDTFKFEGRFGTDTVTDWNFGGGPANADTLDLVGYASHIGSLIVNQQGSDVQITVNDGSVDSHVIVQNQTAANFMSAHITTSGNDILIH